MLRTRQFFDEDRRTSERITVGLPAYISFGDRKYTAKLMNIVREGAMLEMAISVVAGSRIILNCGTLVTEGVVIWNKGDLLGVKFNIPITEAQMREQISRCAALEARRIKSGRGRSS